MKKVIFVKVTYHQAPAGSQDIPGLKSNPDPGILEYKIPGFFWISYIKQNNDLKDLYRFLNKKIQQIMG